MLMTNSNFVGCSTGRSAGLAPFRILSTILADRRNSSVRSALYDMSPPGVSKLTLSINRRQPFLRRKRRNRRTKPDSERITEDQQRIRAITLSRVESAGEVGRIAHFVGSERNAQFGGRSPHFPPVTLFRFD